MSLNTYAPQNAPAVGYGLPGLPVRKSAPSQRGYRFTDEVLAYAPPSALVDSAITYLPSGDLLNQASASRFVDVVQRRRVTGGASEGLWRLGTSDKFISVSWLSSSLVVTVYRNDLSVQWSKTFSQLSGITNQLAAGSPLLLPNGNIVVPFYGVVTSNYRRSGCIVLSPEGNVLAFSGGVQSGVDEAMATFLYPFGEGFVMVCRDNLSVVRLIARYGESGQFVSRPSHITVSASNNQALLEGPDGAGYYFDFGTATSSTSLITIPELLTASGAITPYRQGLSLGLSSTTSILLGAISKGSVFYFVLPQSIVTFDVPTRTLKKFGINITLRTSSTLRLEPGVIGRYRLYDNSSGPLVKLDVERAVNDLRYDFGGLTSEPLILTEEMSFTVALGSALTSGSTVDPGTPAATVVDTASPPSPQSRHFLRYIQAFLRLTTQPASES